jgi:NAD(P)-dependent dehydrogenase (short-subunit alcohol dehydrogenase family)
MISTSGQQTVAQKVVVLTGGTRGIGYGLADSFLTLGCSVVISGREVKNVDEAVARLASKHGVDRVLGRACDVTLCEQVQALWDAAAARFGRVDVWINNAGISLPQDDLCEIAPDQIKAIVDTNTLGAMYGARVAIKSMLEQGSGAVYNMEGLGSDGRRIQGLTPYGTTKYALAYLTDALAEEVKGTPVIVGAIRPGMVITDLITAQYKDRPAEEWAEARRIFNILADRVETVTPWIARKVLDNRKNGGRINWLNPGKVGWRFLTARFRKRDLFSEEQRT